MSMLDTFFNKSFKGAKCKTLLKLTIPRIKLLRNRREIQLKQMRRDIAKLLENGQEATACIRVEHIIREENMMAAQEILELFCELIAVRLPIIEMQRECPLDLKEAISSICFAAPRCSDLPELLQIQMLFAAKYGREFVAAATELMPNCGVNRQIIELLSVRAPSVEAKMKLLKEIAIEHELDWDPAESETELLKPHEDLLNGPNHLLGGSTLSLPKEEHVDSLSSNPVEDSHEESDLDADFDSLDLPEVPKVSVQQSHHIPSAPKITPPLQSLTPLDSGLDHEDLKSTPMDDVSHVYSAEHDVNNPEASTTTPPYAPPNVLADAYENKQFVPFISSPPSLPTSHPLKQKEPASFSSTLVSQSSSEPAPSLSQCKTEANVDLQDVLDAARSAAETAERAAAAARAAASLAQVRISELFTKANNKTSESNEKEVRKDGIDQLEVHERGAEQQNLSRHTSHIPNDVPKWGLNSSTISSHNMHIMEPMSPGSKQQGSVHQAAHQPQRSTSLEDDPYFSYPNLFTSQNSSSKAS